VNLYLLTRANLGIEAIHPLFQDSKYHSAAFIHGICCGLTTTALPSAGRAFTLRKFCGGKGEDSLACAGGRRDSHWKIAQPKNCLAATNPPRRSPILPALRMWI